MTRPLSDTALLFSALLLVVAACGASEDRSDPTEAVGSRAAETVTVEAGISQASEGSRLDLGGASIELPEGWTGRVIAPGVLQAANFEFAPPGVESPQGEEDPIKAMTAEHALVAILPCGIVGFEEPARPAPDRLSLADLTFLPKGHPRLPHNHAFAHTSLDFSGRCVRVEADFGGASPAPKLKDAVNAVLGSLAVAEPSDMPQTADRSE